jgi:hypothetical protein
MESHFGHDFSRVRVHSDASAASRADALGARAFTVLPDIIFGPDQYRPDLPRGQALIAHELTHVVQQEQGKAAGIQRRPPFTQDDDALEREARDNERDIGRRRHGGTLTRQEFLSSVIPPAPPPREQLDQTAKDIIRDAQDTTRDVGVRAVAAVLAIIRAYFPAQQSKVSGVTYDQTDPGLTTTSQGTGATAKGQIAVGQSFVEHTTSQGLARRVLQVAHELEHIDQYRSGLGGAAHRHEREFLAFYHEALAQEVAHTGLMQHSTRIALIDEALGHFACLDAALQKQYSDKQQELLARRAAELKAGGSGPANPPTTCKP